MQIKATVRCHLTSVRVAIKKSKGNTFQQVCGEIETFLHYWQENKTVSMENSFEATQKFKNGTIMYSHSCASFKKTKIKISKRQLQSHVAGMKFHNNQDMDTKQMFINRWINKMCYRGIPWWANG